MADPVDLWVEAERRGILPADKQAILSEARSRGLVEPKDVTDVRAEMNMSSADYDKANKARVMAGGPYRPQPSTLNVIGDRFTDPLGLEDEIAGIGGLTNGIPALLHGNLSEAYDKAGEGYTKAAERIRAERTVSAEKLGRARIPFDVASGIATMGVGAGPLDLATGAAKPFTATAGRPLNSMQQWLRGGTAGASAAQGAGYGAVSGFTNSEGGLENRLLGAGEGGAAGAIAAPLITHFGIPAVGATVRGIANLPNAPRSLRTAFSGDPDAILYRGLRRQDMKPSDAQMYLDTGQDLATYGKTETPLPETIGDTGPAARRLVRAVEALPGEGASKAVEFLDTRQRGSHPTIDETIPNPAYQPNAGQPRTLPNPDFVPGAYSRVTGQLERGLKVTGKDYNKTMERLINEQKTASDPAYQLFRDAVDANGTPVMIPVADILKANAVKDANLSEAQRKMMETARTQFVDKIKSRANDVGVGPGKVIDFSTHLTPERFDNGKRALDEMISDALAKGRNNSARLLGELQDELIARADTETGQSGTSLYAAARDAYSSPAKMQDALKKGRLFMAGSEEVTPADYKAMTTGERKMWRLGMAQRAKRDLGEKTLGSDMVRYFDTPNKNELLSDIMSDNEFMRFKSLNTREANMLSSRKATQGSPTARIQQDIEDMTWLGRQAEGLKERGFAGYATFQVAQAVKRLTRMREQDANALASMLFETDRTKQREILTRLEQTYGAPRAQRGIAAAVRQVRRMQLNQKITQTQQRGAPLLTGETTGREFATPETASPMQ